MRSSRSSLSATVLRAALVLGVLLLVAPADGPAVPSADPHAPQTSPATDSLEARNKALARAFYEDLWFSERTDRWDRYLADEYVLHDIGDDKNVTEPGITQKEIADFFHSKGRMGGRIDYQVAEGDLVATRWQWEFEPTAPLFRLMGGRNPVPIINVFRFEDGKIVEIWNHRHDIDTGFGNIPFVKGLGLGLVLALGGWGMAFVQWRRGRRGA